MHCHCGTHNRAPRLTFTDHCQPEVRPGAREKSVSPARPVAPAINAHDTTNVYKWRFDTKCGPTLHNTPGKRHNNTWVEPLAGNSTTSSTRQRVQLWQTFIIQKNWCTVTVAPTIKHHGGHSRTTANQRWDLVPGRSQRLLRGQPHPPRMPATQRKPIYGGLALDVDRHYIGNAIATTHQEKDILTL